MKFTLYTYFAETLKKLGASGAAKFAADHSFSSVELLEMPFGGRGLVLKSVEEAKALKIALDAQGINMSCLSVALNVFADDCGANKDESAEDILKRCADHAAALGCPYLHHTLTIGLKELPFDAPMTLDGMFDDLCERAERIAKYANSVGVTVIYEPQGMYVNGVEGFGRFYSEMKSRGLAVGICGDIGNTLFVDERPEDFFAAFAKEFVHVHLKDYLKDQKEELPQFAWSSSRGGAYLAETLIGEGIIDYKVCMSHLIDAGYSGSFALESVHNPYSDSYFARDIEYMKTNFPEL